MRLKKVEIKNFRSIEDVTIHFDPRCRILVGINESGKSNILDALSMLSKEKTPSKQDKRMVSPDEAPIREAYVHFVFSLEDDEVDTIVKYIHEKVLTKNRDTFVLKNGSNKFTLEQFCAQRNEGIYRANIIEETKDFSYWGLPPSWEVLGCWKKPAKDCPQELVTEDGSIINLKGRSLINTEDYKGIPKEYLSDIRPAEINSLLGEAITRLVEEELPETVYWSYNEENLLPAQLDLAGFAADPSICKPLKYMFELAEISNIQEEINEAKTASSHDLRNLLNRVAVNATQHFHRIWREYRQIKFELFPNGNLVDITIKDVFNQYELSRRSDGFKRFITFLLMISVRVQTGKLCGALILIDEPDMSLHPSGARYLRDELIRISENNAVVYSTHSIFMIDKEKIERHYIIKKDKEKTAATEVNESNVVDEEVLYNALGYSIFESLNQKNILFEGWRDKKLFKVAMSRVPSKYKHLKGAFENVGITHARGAKDFRNIAPLIELANRECLILSDDDSPSKEKQKEYHKDKGFGVWKRYSEVKSDVEAITGEDFVKPSAFTKLIKTLKKDYPGLSILSEADLCPPKGKIYALQGWLSKGGIDREKRKNILDSIKESVFENLKSAHIDEKYYEFLEKLAEQVAQ